MIIFIYFLIYLLLTLFSKCNRLFISNQNKNKERCGLQKAYRANYQEKTQET